MNIPAEYHSRLLKMLDECQMETDYPEGKRYRGKVRDTYDLGDELLMITTDRLSAFDRFLTLIPGKGRVLTQLSRWWFEQTRDLVPNHLLAADADRSMRVKKCQVYPIEFVVRGYLTGSTDTALWTQYQRGCRMYCGQVLAEGMVKNQPLPTAIITPTTKATDHDQPISPEDILVQGLMTERQWLEASETALALFTEGQRLAAARGLILVDTKYEMGLDQQGRLTLVDELHTPDSSRYWLAESYASRFQAGQEPTSFDKEVIRLWYKAHANPYTDKILPAAPQALVLDVAWRYINLFERITGEQFFE